MRGLSLDSGDVVPRRANCSDGIPGVQEEAIEDGRVWADHVDSPWVRSGRRVDGHIWVVNDEASKGAVFQKRKKRCAALVATASSRKEHTAPVRYASSKISRVGRSKECTRECNGRGNNQAARERKVSRRNVHDSSTRDSGSGQSRRKRRSVVRSPVADRPIIGDGHYAGHRRWVVGEPLGSSSKTRTISSGIRGSSETQKCSEAGSHDCTEY